MRNIDLSHAFVFRGEILYTFNYSENFIQLRVMFSLYRSGVNQRTKICHCLKLNHLDILIESVEMIEYFELQRKGSVM